MHRRQFLKTGIAVTGGVALAGPLQAVAANGAAGLDAGSSARGRGGYGPLAPVADRTTGQELLALPDGFRYWSFDAVGTPMSDGLPVPAAHDGTGAFSGRANRTRLVRNHELGPGAAFVPASLAYDPAAGGGNTIVEFDPRNPSSPRSFAVLSGTIRNCAGGETPWGSWLTCEETTVDNGPVPHGYVFEVPSDATGPIKAVPYKAMGRFAHEAVAVDPITSVVFQTEDAGSTSGFYRYVPHRWGRLGDGGTLQMLTVEGRPGYDASVGQRIGEKLHVDWVTIDQPDPVTGAPTPFAQGAAKGGAAFRRLEGIWWDAWSRQLYFTSTDGGDAAAGQVWRYSPGLFRETLELVYESPGADVLLKPDNLTVSPRHGVLLCEDTDRARQTFLRGLNHRGELYDLAANIRPGTIPGTSTPMSWDEFAGACFSADGSWLFVHVQTPGISFAITGPWGRGPL
jgi:secreted PhoX family phosphatase